MWKSMICAVILAFSLAVVAQQAATTAPAPDNGTAQIPSAAPAIVVKGPVVADYGKNAHEGNSAEDKIAKEVRHQLLMLPYYSLFDNLGYTVQGRTVTLTGTLVARDAVTKRDAETAVKRIEGVENVVNNIQVLPPSPVDEQIREHTFHALVRTSGLSRYFWEAAPSVHIIVANRRVTLEGFVLNEADKNQAGIAANMVPGVLQVTNNLRVVPG